MELYALGPLVASLRSVIRHCQNLRGIASAVTTLNVKVPKGEAISFRLPIKSSMLVPDCLTASRSASGNSSLRGNEFKAEFEESYARSEIPICVLPSRSPSSIDGRNASVAPAKRSSSGAMPVSWPLMVSPRLARSVPTPSGTRYADPAPIPQLQATGDLSHMF